MLVRAASSATGIPPEPEGGVLRDAFSKVEEFVILRVSRSQSVADCADFYGFKRPTQSSCLPLLAFHWETNTVGNFTVDMGVLLMEDAMNLRNLHIVDIEDEKELSLRLECGGF